METRDFVHRWRLEPKPEDIEKYKRGELVEPAKTDCIFISTRQLLLNGGRRLKPVFLIGRKLLKLPVLKMRFVAKDAPTDDPDFDIDDALIR